MFRQSSNLVFYLYFSILSVRNVVQEWKIISEIRTFPWEPQSHFYVLLYIAWRRCNDPCFWIFPVHCVKAPAYNFLIRGIGGVKLRLVGYIKLSFMNYFNLTYTLPWPDLRLRQCIWPSKPVFENSAVIQDLLPLELNHKNFKTSKF